MCAVAFWAAVEFVRGFTGWYHASFVDNRGDVPSLLGWKRRARAPNSAKCPVGDRAPRRLVQADGGLEELTGERDAFLPDAPSDVRDETKGQPLDADGTIEPSSQACHARRVRAPAGRRGVRDKLVPDVASPGGE
eukprot:1769248-Prymnesium_polylepis.1